MSVGRYHAILEEALAGRSPAPEIVLVDDYHDDPGYIAAAAEALRETLGSLAGGGSRPPHVIFTAHSLPARIREAGDPYPGQVEATARLVARAADVQDWEVAWQSASPTGEPWLGPDFIERIREAARAGAAEVVIAPVGFVSDHLEILYDIDVLASEAARAAGCRLSRTPSMNTRPGFIAALASIVRRRLGGSPA